MIAEGGGLTVEIIGGEKVIITCLLRIQLLDSLNTIIRHHIPPPLLQTAINSFPFSILAEANL
jgi:hypothetical protein